MGNFFSSLFTPLAIPAPVANVLFPILQSIAQVWALTWWFFVPLIAALIFWDFWMIYIHTKWLKNIKWVILEIKVPKNILKTPKGMEQIFAAAHTPYTYGLRWQKKYLGGEAEYFMSFELVGRAGETHFYLRVPGQYRNMMESAIFAQYPDAEIAEVDDYVKELPRSLPNDDFDVAGFEVVFSKPNWYPIRTYPAFEESIEEQRIDPISPLIEAMEKMKGDQQLWIQFVVTPEGDSFVKGGLAEINKIHQIEEKKEAHGSFFPKIDLGISLSEAVRAPFEHPGEAKAAKPPEKPAKQRVAALTAAEKEITEGISEKIGKLGLKTTMRIVAIERKGESTYGNMGTLTLVLSFLRQFNILTLQSMRPDKETRTFSIYGFFKDMKQRFRKRGLYDRYQYLSQNPHAPIMNTEELATMYHFPITAVSSTGLDKVESKKGAPPQSLPIVEEPELPEVSE